MSAERGIRLGDKDRADDDPIRALEILSDALIRESALATADEDEGRTVRVDAALRRIAVLATGLAYESRVLTAKRDEQTVRRLLSSVDADAQDVD